jgi:isopentenyldiphosphate isomerase
MEILDLYDEQGRRLGRTMDRACWSKRTDEYVKVVHVFLMNGEGDILIQQRAFEKPTWPGMWSVLGGFVQSCEEPEEAVIRETAEEYGVDISGCSRRMVYRIVHKPRGAIMEYWMVLGDVRLSDVVCQPEEVAAAAYATPEALGEIYAGQDRWSGDDGTYREEVLDLIAGIPRIFSEMSGV